jgi:hypothetical protein
MQQQAQAPPKRGAVQPPGIVFDSDMGRNIDAALALAMLYNLGPKGRPIAVSVSNSSLEAAAFCDAVARFYTGDPVAQSTGAREIMPVGLVENGARLASAPMLSAPLALKKTDGSAAFHSGVADITDTADVNVLIRNALSTQKDGEGIVVLAGPATNLVRALAWSGAKDTIAAKVGLLVVAAGEFAGGSADVRIKADVASAKQLFARWPSPIMVVGMEVGAALPYPGSSIETDYSWSPNHPIVEAYRAFKTMPYDAPSQALAAVLFAANQKESYFRLSEPGAIEVLDDGRTRFTRSETGKHRYLIADPAQKEIVIKAFTELASAKPAAPAGRAPRPQATDPATPKTGGKNQQ